MRHMTRDDWTSIVKESYTVKDCEYSGIINSSNSDAAEESLRAAAYTYVVAALSSLGTLLYYVLIFMGRRD